MNPECCVADKFNYDLVERGPAKSPNSAHKQVLIYSEYGRLSEAVRAVDDCDPILEIQRNSMIEDPKKTSN